MTNFELALLNQYIEKVNGIFNLFMKDISDSSTEHFKQIIQAADNLGNIWNKCLSQRATLKDFENALNQWQSHYVNAIEQTENPQPIKGQKKLTRKQQLFIEYYVKYGVGAKAARLAGYSARSAKKIAFINLCKPRIKSLINKELKAKNHT